MGKQVSTYPLPSEVQIRAWCDICGEEPSAHMVWLRNTDPRDAQTWIVAWGACDEHLKLAVRRLGYVRRTYTEQGDVPSLISVTMI